MLLNSQSSCKSALLVTIAFGTLALGACLGEVEDSGAPGVTYLDTDGNGGMDAIDVDGDGAADYALAEEQSGVRNFAGCLIQGIDLDGDGRLDGIDTDCDGIIDIELGPVPSGDSSSSSCSSAAAINGQSVQIECSSNGGAFSCTCTRNGVTERTCTTTSSSACSISGDNCCGY